MKENNKKKKKKKKSGIRLFFKIILGIIIFIILLLLFIRSPWGQGIIVNQLISYISGKTDTEVQVDKLYITPGGDLSIHGLYLEDEEGDTLLYSRELEADIGLWNLINMKSFAVENLEWTGVIAHIKREDTIEGFNFSFLMEALVPAADTTAPAAPVDTTATPMVFELGDMMISDFEATYDDEVMGIEARIDLGELNVEMQEFSLDSMLFEVGDASLLDTRFSYVQHSPFPQSEPQEDAPPLPFLSVERLAISNVSGDYQSIPDGFFADVDIDKFLLKMPKADLAEQEIVVEMLGLKDSEMLISTSTTTPNLPAENSSSGETSPEAFQWPEWDVKIDRIALVDNRFKMISEGATATPGQFNPNAVVMSDFNLMAKDILLADQSFHAEVQALNFSENSGLDLKKGEFVLDISEDNLELQNLEIRLNENYIRGDAFIDYASLQEFIENPENAQVALDLPQFNVDLSDLFKFQPELRQNEVLAKLAKKRISGNLTAQGELSEVQITNSRINWGESDISLSGTVYNVTDPENLQFEFSDLQFNSSRGDLLQFVSEEQLGIKLPDDLKLTGSFSGTPDDLTVDAILESSFGKINVDGKFVTAPGLAFDATISAEELKLGELLENTALGPISFNIETAGEGENINELDAVLEGRITSLGYNEYTFEDIEIFAQIEEGEGFATLDYKDENLNMELESFVQLDSIAPTVALQLNVIGADLQALGITPRPVNTSFELRTAFEGNANSFDVTTSLTEGIFVYDNESYLLGDLEGLAHVRPDTTSVAIDNRMLQLVLKSNSNPTEFITALDRHYQSYFSDVDRTDTIEEFVNLELHVEVSPSPILDQIFLPALDELDTLDVHVNFSEREKQLAANISLPYVQYMGSEIDSLQFEMNSDPEGMVFDFGLSNLNVGPLDIQETSLEGELVDEELLLEFRSEYDEKPLMHIVSAVSRQDDVLRIHVVPDTLLLNSLPWNIPAGNEILVGDGFMNFNDFQISREDQLLEASNSIAGIDGEHIGINFENFNLAALFSYLNPEDPLAAGSMNGNLIFEDPFGSTGIIAELGVDEFAVLAVPLGDLVLDAEAIGFNTYDFDMAIKDGNADLDLEGSYVASEGTANWDMQLDITRLDMEVFRGFFPDLVTEAGGSLSGEFALRGTTLEPIYEGTLIFDDAMVHVAFLDAPFTFPDEDLFISNERIVMENFEIQDLNGNSLILDGAVLTENLLNPAFDISYTANNFTAMQSTAEDNELYYGTAIVDATGSVTGNLELPVIEMDLDVLENTDVTYVIPETSIEIQEREGIVIFVNRENPNRILTQRSEEDEAVTFSGMVLNSYISVQENSTITVVIDSETGDHFTASGEGDLLFDIYPNGRSTLSGRFEIADGYYEMSLYDLVTRRFDLLPGSSVVWAGDPLDADLDITAVYEVETSAAALMAPVITGADMDVQQRFQQELEFLVYLNIGGEITEPEISFGLDLPEDEQGVLGGQVYGRVQQINSQEGELNKQVFSLLVLNRFFPGGGSTGAGGGTLAFARDNLNQALSDQLNTFSDRLLGETGLNLNFGLDTYTDYLGESPEERTELAISAEKSFLDDRLIVSVGSEVELQGSEQVEESPLVGNVSLEYLLSPDGDFRLKAFRKKSYENVIDGQLIITGLALIYQQQFNRFYELWDQIVQDEKQQKQEAEEPENIQE